MAWMKWKYNDMKNFVLRNKIGFIVGLGLGIIISYLYWTKNNLLGQKIMTYATYPLHLLFGCNVQFYGLIILTLIFGIVGLCLSGIFKKWQLRDDRNRGLVILAILIIILGGIYYIRDVNNTFCIDTNRDGQNDLSIIKTTGVSCNSYTDCLNVICEKKPCFFNCVKNICQITIPSSGGGGGGGGGETTTPPAEIGLSVGIELG